MDNDTASESNKPVNEEKTKDNAKISDDELILRRKRQNAERGRAYRERKKGSRGGPSSSPECNTSIAQSGEPVSKNTVLEKTLHQKRLNAERCRRYRQKRKRLKSGASCNQGTIFDDELILRRKRQNAARVRAYRERKKAFRLQSSSQAVLTSEPPEKIVG
ncbi:hypothetical protein EVAR_102910_1 [Eumeta japonica]|uniref:Uncharacterized protein n=1 Tax=Eumeta variegata TaxID=151549 RepID=A0A4C1ZQH8_EUMVA|nr:hypothetical protein EVAR_102910_1 [Eumeta japonica]